MSQLNPCNYCSLLKRYLKPCRFGGHQRCLRYRSTICTDKMFHSWQWLLHLNIYAWPTQPIVVQVQCCLCLASAHTLVFKGHTVELKDVLNVWCFKAKSASVHTGCATARLFLLSSNLRFHFFVFYAVKIRGGGWLWNIIRGGSDSFVRLQCFNFHNCSCYWYVSESCKVNIFFVR